MIHIGGNTYELIKENKNGWNPEAFRERYSDVLERYDYIVGDWGYNQLRLKGFFKESNAKGNKDASISNLQDYLNEYCNFGCAYFVIERQNVKNQRHGEKGTDDGEESDEPAGQSERPAAGSGHPAVHYAKGMDNGRNPTHYNRAGVDPSAIGSRADQRDQRKSQNESAKVSGDGSRQAGERGRGPGENGRAPGGEQARPQGKPHNRQPGDHGRGGKNNNNRAYGPNGGGGNRGQGDGGRRQGGGYGDGGSQRGAGDAPRGNRGKGNETGAPA